MKGEAMTTNNRTGDGLLLVGATIGFFALGGAAGYVAGLLSAPASGQETRRRLGRRLEDGRDEVVRRGQRALHGAMDRVQDGIDRGRKRLNRTFAA
jgi:gas vesicle protein